jgi:hypothetical protein
MEDGFKHMNMAQRIPVIHFPIYARTDLFMKKFLKTQNSEGHIHRPKMFIWKKVLTLPICHILSLFCS